MASAVDQFIHVYQPPAEDGPDVTLLLLHGTGGDEHNLIQIGEMLAPGAGLLSPRGQVRENGTTNRWFKRVAMGVFDENDLITRTNELADYIPIAAGEYGFDPEKVVAVGFSNGANIAASLLLLRPEALAGAILLRPMIPIHPETPPQHDGTPVLITGGELDAMIPPPLVRELADVLRNTGADVQEHWEREGHTLSAAQISTAVAWIKEHFGG